MISGYRAAERCQGGAQLLRVSTKRQRPTFCYQQLGVAVRQVKYVALIGVRHIDAVETLPERARQHNMHRCTLEQLPIQVRSSALTLAKFSSDLLHRDR